MEQYLFRGIKEGTNEFVYGSLLQSEIDVNKLNVKCFICERFMHDAQITTIPVIPSTVGMWTTKEDINGNKIFSGDILFSESWGLSSRAPNKYHVVDWGDCGWVAKGYNGNIKVSPQLDVKNDFEIKGNIHTTPELLNQSK